MSVKALRAAVGMDALRGHTWSGPPSPSSVVRVYLSSTCSDMIAERNALWERAFPEVQSFCQTLGLTLEVVDLRWGVRDMVSVDHMTSELSLEEIRCCQRDSVGPTFIALLGNRYGHRPIPRLIPEREFELLVGKLSDLDDIKFLNKWFWRDDNAVPPTYVLQPISRHFSHYGDAAAECVELRDQDALSWQYTEARLLRLLRCAALQAEKSGQLTPEQKHAYFKSVTEWEMEQGLLAAQTPESSTVLFVREFPKLRKKEMQKSLAAFTDLTVDGLVDSEAQELLSGLKARLLSACSSSLNQHSVEHCKTGIEPSRKEHGQYLSSLCEQLVSQMKEKIQQKAGGGGGARVGGGGVKGGAWGGGGQGEGWGWLQQEIHHHMRVCARECGVFCGRESLIERIRLTALESTNGRRAPPLVVFGPAGVGKTALMCKLALEMRGHLGPQAAVVLRLLGSTPLSSDLDGLLRGVCLQVCGAFGLPLPTSSAAHTHQELVRFFHLTLEEVSARGEKLLLVLDALERLSSSSQSAHYRLHWLPKLLPPHVHIVVSVPDAAGPPPLLTGLRGTIEEPGSFFEVEPLAGEQGRAVVDAYLTAAGRALQPEQTDVLLRSFRKSGGSLLPLRVTLHTALRWTSYTHAADVQVGHSMQEAVDLLLDQLEKRHGRLLVSRALGYIASARDGLSEAELRDVLSLDDEVLAEVYRHWLPPNTSLVRLPPLLWARLRHDLNDLLLERQTAGVHLLTCFHRQLRERVRERYLRGEQGTQRHTLLAEYFQGLWSASRLKPIQLPHIQTQLNADRKVPSEPLWFAEGVANLRKLRELPYHLLHADKWEELCHMVIGNMEWLCCKAVSCGVAAVIEDLSLCTTLYECPELQLIQDAFVLIKPTLDFIDAHIEPSLLYTEVFGRLHVFSETYPALIGRLCSQCQDWFASYADPVLVPKSSFLPPPGGALKSTLTGFNKGVTAVDVCPTNDLLVAGSEDGLLIAWNMRDLEIIHTLVAHTGPVLAVRVVHGGSSCLSCGGDAALTCWSLKTGKQMYCIRDAVSADTENTHTRSPGVTHTHTRATGTQHSAICCVVEESAVVFTQAPRQCVKAWHLDTGEALYDVGPPEQASMLETLSGSVCVLSDGDLLTFYKASTGLESMQTRLSNPTHTLTPTHTLDPTHTLSPIHTHRPKHTLTITGALHLPRHDTLLLASREGHIHQVCISGRHEVTDLPGSASFLSVSEDERTLLAGCERVLVLLQLQPGGSLQRHCELSHDATVLTAVASSQAGVVVSGAEDQLIRVWCLSSGKLLDTFHGVGSRVTSLAVFGETVVSASACSGQLKVWQLNSDPKHKAKTSVPANCSLVTLSKDGQTAFFVKHGNRKEVFTWDCTTGDITSASADAMDTSAEVLCLELAQQKRLLFCGLRTGTVMIYPLDFPLETLCIPPLEDMPQVQGMTISPHEVRMAVAYDDAVCLFEITARDSFPCVDGPFERFPLTLLRSPLSCMALLADCRLLCGTERGDVTLYDFKSASSTPLDRHAARVTCVALSHRSGQALVGSQDCVQRLWSLSPLRLDHTMDYRGFLFEGVLCAAFSVNDQYVFTGSQDKTIKVWDVASGRLLYVQYVYSPIVRMLTQKDGLVAVSQLGHLIKEAFRCPGEIRSNFTPLRKFQAQFRLMYRLKKLDPNVKLPGETQDNNEEKAKAKPSNTCILL
ncbi:NACHT domain- and WD repeat-containing protein 1 [Alosa sapidissima]|uniref:NACHT domain- and WD repeat-containing protein 1 n=1 Tax=Alosa sapidissima TaxID=34773 RepID=UPI001C0911F3|nr:NACHT domain- and WD repeat-containing protein 1 [Alosa sapidissima]